MTRDGYRILLGRSLRSFADGYVAVLLPLHVTALGFEAIAVGAISTATLLGSALLTLAFGLGAHHVQRRVALMCAALLMAATGFGFATVQALGPLLIIAFVGTLNPSGGDVSVFLPLEHTVLSQTASDNERTAVFARYSFAAALFGSLGALAAGSVDWLARWIAPSTTISLLFALYGVIGLLTFLLYGSLSRRIEREKSAPPAPLTSSRRQLYSLAALFSLDSFGSGFVINALLALWLFERFGLSVSMTASIFFATKLCAAVSQLVAVPVARRFGLINTMVFTHLPANLFLILVAFAPNVEVVFLLLILRGLLSEMDVPTRSSYVMAIVKPEERPAAASITAVPKSLASAVAPVLSGWLFTLTPFAWPLVIAGGLKAGYDLLLLWRFAHVKPPEEQLTPRSA